MVSSAADRPSPDDRPATTPRPCAVNRPGAMVGRRTDVRALVGVDLEHFAERLLADALAEATAAFWLRRAAEIDRARHRPGDFPGTVTEAQRRERDDRLAATALACRRRAQLALLDAEHLDALVAAALQETVA